jgi:hypothetical protein
MPGQGKTRRRRRGVRERAQIFGGWEQRRFEEEQDATSGARGGCGHQRRGADGRCGVFAGFDNLRAGQGFEQTRA